MSFQCPHYTTTQMNPHPTDEGLATLFGEIDGDSAGEITAEEMKALRRTKGGKEGPLAKVLGD